jgi:hypothetical protein
MSPAVSVLKPSSSLKIATHRLQPSAAFSPDPAKTPDAAE